MTSNDLFVVVYSPKTPTGKFLLNLDLTSKKPTCYIYVRALIELSLGNFMEHFLQCATSDLYVLVAHRYCAAASIIPFKRGRSPKKTSTRYEWRARKRAKKDEGEHEDE